MKATGEASDPRVKSSPLHPVLLGHQLGDVDRIFGHYATEDFGTKDFQKARQLLKVLSG